MSEVIYLATDHAGFEHKNAIKAWLIGEGYEIHDCGASTHDVEDDFPDFISKAAEAVSHATGEEKAIIFGGSGQGEAINANRFIGVRAAVYYGGPEEIITLSREHNDANVLSVGARFVSVDEAKAVIWKWLHTAPLHDEKYNRRNHKIDLLTKKTAGFLK